MTQKIIHFAHANGFPAGSYKKFLGALPKNYHIEAKDKFAHDKLFPLNDNWSNQVDELIAYIEHQLTENRVSTNQPKVIAMGHSFGAVLSYMAVCKRPDLFSGLVMLDPPLITGLARYVFRFAKKTRLIDKLTPSGITEVRNYKWSRDHDLHKYFSSKTLFKDFDPDCIGDYLDSVIEEQGEHKHLSFDVSTEANIFRTIPHNLPAFKGQLTIPSVLITAKNTNVCVPVLRNPFLKNNPLISHLEFPLGGHMFPLEHPNTLANTVASLLASFD